MPDSPSSSLRLRHAQSWDEQLWTQVRPVYEASFPAHVRKPERIVRRMLERMDAFLHEGRLDGASCAMALTGLSADRRLLIVDYLAVSPDRRESGIGRHMVEALAKWAQETHGVDGLLIEAEADDSEEGRGRVRFWENCGFVSTEYVHRYVWVPERYRAMLLDLQGGDVPPADRLPRDGRTLFASIEAFHRSSFAR